MRGIKKCCPTCGSTNRELRLCGGGLGTQCPRFGSLHEHHDCNDSWHSEQECEFCYDILPNHKSNCRLSEAGREPQPVGGPRCPECGGQVGWESKGALLRIWCDRDKDHDVFIRSLDELGQFFPVAAGSEGWVPPDMRGVILLLNKMASEHPHEYIAGAIHTTDCLRCRIDDERKKLAAPPASQQATKEKAE